MFEHLVPQLIVLFCKVRSLLTWDLVGRYRTLEEAQPEPLSPSALLPDQHGVTAALCVSSRYSCQAFSTVRDCTLSNCFGFFKIYFIAG